MKSSHYPSPDSYQPDSHPVSLKCVFGKDKREPSYIRPPKTPAPNAYNIIPLKPGTPSYSLAAKLPFHSRSISPPPTAYNTDKTEYILPKWSFGKSRRIGIPPPTGPDNPGPGRYNPADLPTVRKSPVYSMKDRVKISGVGGPDPDSPSPATYGGLYTQFG